MRAMATTTKQTELDPRDFLAIDALLDDEEKAIRDTVRQFVRRTDPARGRRVVRAGDPAARAHRRGRASSASSGCTSRATAYPGASSVAYGLTCMELEAGDSGVRSLVSVQGSLAMFPIWRWGSEEQKERWLPPMHAGEVDRLLRSDRARRRLRPGRDAHARAKRDGSDWILNGTKMWITNGTIADVAIVWARTDDGADHGFLVEKGMPGFEAPEIKHKLSLRASVTSELVLQDVRVPEENLLPGAFVAARPAVVPERGAFRHRLGRGRRRARVLRVALEYAKERIVFGKPIAGYQLTQQKLAEMALEINRRRSSRSTSGG